MSMDIKLYRIMDLAMLTVLALVMQVLGTFLHNALPGAGYSLNLAVLITLIAVYRWGLWGTLVLMLSGIPMIFMGANNLGINLLMHVAAPGAVAMAALLLQKMGQEKILNNTLYLFIFTVMTFMAIAFGQGVVMIFLGEPAIGTSIQYFLANSFNLIMTYVILLLIRKRPGLMIDMKKYFEREQNNHEFSS